MKCISAMVLALGIIGLSSTAFAQQQQELDQGNIIFLISCAAVMPSSTTSSSAGYAIKSREEDLREDIKRLESIVKLRQYLNANEQDVLFAVHLGAGESLKEIIALIRPHSKLTRDLARNIRKSRKSLGAILKRPDSFERAELLYDTLKPVMDATPRSTVWLSVTGEKEAQR